MKHRARIEQLAIELETMLLSGERGQVIDPARMVEQQRRLGIPDKLGDLTGEAGLGNADSFDRNVFSAANVIALLLRASLVRASPAE